MTKNEDNKITSKNPTEQEFSVSSDAVLVIDRALRLISMSEAAEQIIGYSVNNAVGSTIFELFGENNSLNPLIQKTLDEQKSVSNIEITLDTPNNHHYLLTISLSPLRDVAGKSAGVVLTLQRPEESDVYVQQLKARSYKLLIEKNKLEGILNSITDGVFTIDSEWRITSFNNAAEHITGYPVEEAIGKNCGKLLRGSHCEHVCPMRKTIESGKPTFNEKVEIITKDGTKVPISVNTALLYDSDGEVIGAVETFRDLTSVHQLTEALEGRYNFDNIIGKSRAMQEIYDLLQNVVESDATVLIQGESGTGKELVARAIHFNSARRNKPFVAVNCSALVETLLESELFGHEKGAFTGAIKSRAGRFELANGGTLFLDEVGDMSPNLQAKLLRVLDEQKFERVGGTKPIRVNVRIISATNKDLLNAISDGTFREDLYYRLNVVPIMLPPLRERSEDIPILIEHFITHFNRKTGKQIRTIASEALDVLISYHWPGNIRELENAMEQAFVRCQGEVIKLEHLPPLIRDSLKRSTKVEFKESQNPFEEAEKQMLIQVLQKVSGSRIKAARLLGVSKATLWRKMKKYGMINED